MASLDAISAFGNAFTNMLGLGLNESQNRRTNELDWKINQDNIFAAKEINESQLAAARENWKREQQNFETQREWSLQDRAFENFYNSPYQQKLRYQQAGLNPALMLEGQSAVGSAQASTGTAPNFGSPPPMQSVENKFHYTPMDYSGLGLGFERAMDAFLYAQKQESDISTSNARLTNETLHLIDSIQNSSVDRSYKDKLIKSVVEDWQFNKDSHHARLESINNANSKLRAETTYTEQLSEAQRFANSIAPELHDLNKRQLASNIAVAAAQYDELMSRSDLNNEQKELVGKKIAEQVILNSNLPKSLHNDNSIKVATYKQIQKQAALIGQQTETESWRTLDARKGYRQHIGSDRSLDDIIEHAIKKKGKVPSLQ